jgi:hypothetical protein
MKERVGREGRGGKEEEKESRRYLPKQHPH